MLKSSAGSPCIIGNFVSIRLDYNFSISFASERVYVTPGAITRHPRGRPSALREEVPAELAMFYLSEFHPGKPVARFVFLERRVLKTFLNTSEYGGTCNIPRRVRRAAARKCAHTFYIDKKEEERKRVRSR